MEKFSKKDLEKQAAAFMKAHDVDTFLATEDGNFFHPKDECLANDHNFKNVKGEVYVFGKIDKIEEVEKVEKAEKVEEVEKVEKAEKVEEVEKVEKAEKVEKQNKPTKP